MDNQIITILIGLVGGGGGLFALIKFIISQNNKSQEKFLNHLEIKNGHLERVSEKFNETAKKFNDTIQKLEINLEKNFIHNKNEHDKIFETIRNY